MSTMGPEGAAPVDGNDNAAQQTDEAQQNGSDQQTEDGQQDEDRDWRAEYEKVKAESRKHERRARENAQARRDLEALQAKSLPDQERQVAEAADKARREARTEFGQRLASAEIRAALTGIVAEPGDIIEDLNLARYVTDDGEVDEDAVSALKQKYSSLMGVKRTPKVGAGQTGKPPKVPSAADEFAATINGLLGR